LDVSKYAEGKTMVQRGTVLNGVIVPDGPPPPEGTRVMFDHDEVYEYPHPMAPYDEEKELALLREIITQMNAGTQGRPAEDVFNDIERDLNSHSNGRG
jgi:hypothetical protein